MLANAKVNAGTILLIYTVQHYEWTYYIIGLNAILVQVFLSTHTATFILTKVKVTDY